MLSWGEFERAEPELAEAGQGLIYQFGGVGLAFLSTVRRDGGPRVHPMCPLIFEGRLLAFLIPSPKSNDLLRDARYALHCFPPADNEDAFYVTGRARLCEEKALRKAADERFWDERPSGQRDPDFDEQRLFEFLIETALLTRTTGHGDWEPKHTIWHA
jgi:hypothetical protein